MSNVEIGELVYEQWLIADLTELECSCLPQGLADHKKYQLTGTYSLQVW